MFNIKVFTTSPYLEVDIKWKGCIHEILWVLEVQNFYDWLQDKQQPGTNKYRAELVLKYSFLLNYLLHHESCRIVIMWIVCCIYNRIRASNTKALLTWWPIFLQTTNLKSTRLWQINLKIAVTARVRDCLRWSTAVDWTQGLGHRDILPFNCPPLTPALACPLIGLGAPMNTFVKIQQIYNEDLHISPHINVVLKRKTVYKPTLVMYIQGVFSICKCVKK